jgi:Phosphate-selective porin O and P
VSTCPLGIARAIRKLSVNDGGRVRVLLWSSRFPPLPPHKRQCRPHSRRRPYRRRRRRLGRGGFAEYARTTQDILTAGVPRTVTNEAWGVTASYVLTGEATSDRGVRPKAPFNPSAGTWGAVQVAARYAQITLDEDLFASGIATPTASQKAQQMTFDTNWFLNNYVKFYATYERFMFSGLRANENLILFRAQLAF